MRKVQIQSVKHIIVFLEKAIIIFTSILMILLTSIVFFNVIARYFFDIPIAFTYEMVELLFPWIVFLAVINVTLDNENIDIHFFVRLTPNPFQIFAAYFTKAIMLFFSVYITISSFSLASTVQNHTMPILGISKSWLYWSVSISFIGVSLVIIYQVILMMTRKEDVREGGDEL